jgi:hypothetical protein
MRNLPEITSPIIAIGPEESMICAFRPAIAWKR